MRPGRKAIDDHWLAGGVRPVPGGVIDGDVDMANPWRYSGSGRSRHRQHLDILGPIMEKHEPSRQLVWKWCIDNELRGGDYLSSTYLQIRPLWHFELDDVLRDGLVNGTL